MIECLKDHTYLVRHNPNCPMPFEVRICGNAPVVAIPTVEWTRTRTDVYADKNFVGYGKTAEEAGQRCLEQEASKRWVPRFRDLWDGL